ncbi:Ribonuclease 3like [Caligus rogercresseyi]|uniref:Ribonuclease 3like n=1 Tax=Caligus rogercresseyi TaxID=217165 RepID=A0A7T8GQ45_CALRO|nr:Ribonuclease 3like [Caligus rogercresseyi]
MDDIGVYSEWSIGGGALSSGSSIYDLSTEAIEELQESWCCTGKVSRPFGVV